MRNSALVAIALIAVGCSEKSEKSAGQGSAGGTEPTEPNGAKPANPDGAKPDGAKPDGAKPDGAKPDGAKPTCDCRMLTKSSLADLEGGAFEKACEGLKLTSGASCEQFDRLRNCIYATRGNKFKKKKWQSAFGDLDWYKPRDDFKPSELTKLELANIRALKARAKTCRAASGGKVGASDKAAIKAWFANRTKKTPALVFHEIEEGASKNPKKDIAARLDYFELGDETTFWYRARSDSDGLNKALKGKDHRVIVVGNCYVCDEEDLDCEGGCDTFEAVLGAKDEIIAIYLTVAAACPAVYAASADRPLALQGEILRHLDRPTKEGSQSLGLNVTCDGPIRVRLAEEKPEVTFLDDIALEVDGVRYAPLDCDAPHCGDDGRYTRMSPGDTIDLVFAVEATRCRRVMLVADGFYMPL